MRTAIGDVHVLDPIGRFCDRCFMALVLVAPVARVVHYYLKLRAAGVSEIYPFLHGDRHPGKFAGRHIFPVNYVAVASPGEADDAGLHGADGFIISPVLAVGCAFPYRDVLAEYFRRYRVYGFCRVNTDGYRSEEHTSELQ